MIEDADYRLVAHDDEPIMSMVADFRDDWEKVSAARWNPHLGWHQPLGHDWMYQPGP